MKECALKPIKQKSAKKLREEEQNVRSKSDYSSALKANPSGSTFSLSSGSAARSARSAEPSVTEAPYKARCPKLQSNPSIKEVTVSYQNYLSSECPMASSGVASQSPLSQMSRQDYKMDLLTGDVHTPSPKTLRMLLSAPSQTKSVAMPSTKTLASSEKVIGLVMEGLYRKKPAPHFPSLALCTLALPISQASTIALPISQASTNALPISQASTIALPILQASTIALPISQASKIALPISQGSTIALPISQASTIALPISQASTIALPISQASETALPSTSSESDSSPPDAPCTDPQLEEVIDLPPGARIQICQTQPAVKRAGPILPLQPGATKMVYVVNRKASAIRKPGFLIEYKQSRNSVCQQKTLGLSDATSKNVNEHSGPTTVSGTISGGPATDFERKSSNLTIANERSESVIKSETGKGTIRGGQSMSGPSGVKNVRVDNFNPESYSVNIPSNSITVDESKMNSRPVSKLLQYVGSNVWTNSDPNSAFLTTATECESGSNNYEKLLEGGGKSVRANSKHIQLVNTSQSTISSPTALTGVHSQIAESLTSEKDLSKVPKDTLSSVRNVRDVKETEIAVGVSKQVIPGPQGRYLINQKIIEKQIYYTSTNSFYQLNTQSQTMQTQKPSDSSKMNRNVIVVMPKAFKGSTGHLKDTAPAQRVSKRTLVKVIAPEGEQRSALMKDTINFLDGLETPSHVAPSQLPVTSTSKSSKSLRIHEDHKYPKKPSILSGQADNGVTTTDDHLSIIKKAKKKRKCNVANSGENETGTEEEVLEDQINGHYEVVRGAGPEEVYLCKCCEDKKEIFESKMSLFLHMVGEHLPILKGQCSGENDETSNCTASSVRRTSSKSGTKTRRKRSRFGCRRKIITVMMKKSLIHEEHLYAKEYPKSQERKSTKTKKSSKKSAKKSNQIFYECDECSVEFPSVASLRYHKAHKHPSDIYCPIRQVQFGTLQSHVEKPFLCPDIGCGMSFGNSRQLKKHHKCHIKQCEYCDFRCNWQKPLDTHMREHHSEIEKMKCTNDGDIDNDNDNSSYNDNNGYNDDNGYKVKDNDSVGAGDVITEEEFDTDNIINMKTEDKDNDEYIDRYHYDNDDVDNDTDRYNVINVRDVIKMEEDDALDETDTCHVYKYNEDHNDRNDAMYIDNDDTDVLDIRMDDDKDSDNRFKVVDRGGVCQQCGHEYLTDHGLSRHLQRKHGVVDQQSLTVTVVTDKTEWPSLYKCDECQSEYSTKDLLSDHILKEHIDIVLASDSEDDEKG